MEQFRKAGVDATFLPAAETSTSVLGQVAIGVGMAIVPDNLRRGAPSGVVFRPIDTGMVFQYEAAWKAERASPPMRAFLQVVRELTGLKT
jgi:DNA-binding transcriptional LysR family regulator